MGTKYLIDTNAVIEFLGGHLPTSGSVWLQSIIDKDLYYLSVINQIELLGYNGSPAEMQTLQDFVNASDVLLLSDLIVQTTISLRKSHKIKLPDAIIAATALTYNLTIITRNTADFAKISGISCVNAHKK